MRKVAIRILGTKNPRELYINDVYMLLTQWYASEKITSMSQRKGASQRRLQIICQNMWLLTTTMKSNSPWPPPLRSKDQSSPPPAVAFKLCVCAPKAQQHQFSAHKGNILSFLRQEPAWHLDEIYRSSGFFTFIFMREHMGHVLTTCKNFLQRKVFRYFGEILNVLALIGETYMSNFS